MTEPISFNRAVFQQSSPSVSQCPPDTGIEVAFAGRSNAGKSSAINALTRNGKLARTGKTPGRTQLINFFSFGDGLRLVDLPGYGFAKVPKSVKQAWDQNLAGYLQERRSLSGLVLLMDIRHPMQDYDMQVVRWADQSELPVHILLTKADKLKFGPGKAVMWKVRKQLQQENLNAQITLQLFSALKRDGLEQLADVLHEWYKGSEITCE